MPPADAVSRRPHKARRIPLRGVQEITGGEQVSTITRAITWATAAPDLAAAIIGVTVVALAGAVL
jgi:hypothetical protein